MSTPGNPPLRLASTVLLLRDGAAGLEVFMVVRHQEIDFASGALVFPGGKLAAGDADPRLRARCSGAESLGEEQLALRVGAVREVYEECGVLLARARGESALLGAQRLAALEPCRGQLERGELGMAELLEREDLVLAGEALVAYAHWITPLFMPKRFDTYFYLAVAPQQAALHDGREAVDSVWLRPAEALAQAAAGTRTIVPATLLNIERLGKSADVASALEAARTQPLVTVLPELVSSSRSEVRLRIPADAGYGVSEFVVPIPG
jgi:8-oxo-dGTP pyrophosphatase MutT (NUDIX family)